MDYQILLQLMDSSIRMATPLLLACLAGLYSERAGIFDIGLEGKMLIAACLAASAAFVTQSMWIGILAGIGGSLAFSLIHGAASITFRGNQLISGVALNFLASGLATLMAQSWFRQGGRTPSLSNDVRIPEIAKDVNLDGIPILGPFISEVVLGHVALVYVAFAAVPLTWWVLYRTRFGLRLRAVGEAPEAVDTAGISVPGLRFKAVLICGVLCGIAGAYMSIGLQPYFGKDMTAGRGYIALAALIFAKWRPWTAMWACLLFGFLQAFSIRFQSLSIFDFEIPLQFMVALPYILTVAILAGFVGRAIPPRAGGEPYVKEN